METSLPSQGFVSLREGCWLEVIDTAGAGFEEEKGEDSSKAGSSGSDFSTSNPSQAELTARVVRELVQSGKGPGLLCFTGVRGRFLFGNETGG